MKVTICTPTYNRAYCLGELYESLINQNCKDFEWIIVDDGSNDNTQELVEKWINENKILIKYFKKANGGKHTAINVGVENALGEYFLIVDSDDCLTTNAIMKIVNGFKNIPIDYAGISFNKVFKDGTLVGSTFNGEYVDATSLERRKYNIHGDKAECFYTTVLKKYPFPVFEGENFLSEAVVWYRIAADGHKIRWYNGDIYICQYRNDGLSMNASGAKNFNGYTLFVKELLSYKDALIIDKIKFLGVYAYVSKTMEYTDKQISKMVSANTFFVKMSRWFYQIKKTRKSNRREKFKVK